MTAACDLDEMDVKDQDGSAVKVEGKGAKKVLTAPDGTQYTVKPGGTIIDSEGNKTKIKRDGTIVQPDGSKVNIYGDGTKTTLKVDGVQLNKDGSKVIEHDDGSKTFIKADGSVERVYKDGTKTKLSTKTDDATQGEGGDGEAKPKEESKGGDDKGKTSDAG
ncbi:MAG: hypothetical protein KC486_00470 [Myxococcales bacterium]|nr:hypothetical protein [Myxococcales bacterium]